MTIWSDVAGATRQSDGRPSVVTIGNFDGVHRGHQSVLARARALADGRPVRAVTFFPHPIEVLAPPHAPRRISTIERRVELLREHGADEVWVLDFTVELAAWPAERFVDDVVLADLHAAQVVVGENFRFGARALGDVPLLRERGAPHGLRVEALDLDGGEQPFSSTLVRAQVADADLRGAAVVLGRPHEVSGVVVRGDQRGRELGFPTANVPVDEAYAVPPDGVYAGRLVRATGERLPAAVSIGTNPTFDGVERRVESYVLDRTDLDLYGESVRVELVERLRGMERFDGIDPLVEQMHRDVADARRVLDA